MSIAPLNISATGDAGAGYALPATGTRPDPMVSTVGTAAPAGRRVSESEVNDAVDKLNDFAASNNSALNFSQDKETGKTIVKVVDTETNAVIRQIPSEEAVAVARSIDRMQGLLINHKA